MIFLTSIGGDTIVLFDDVAYRAWLQTAKGETGRDLTFHPWIFFLNIVQPP